jgi:CRISPR/Cas system-associated protein endoribonuclease Cas2
MNAYSTLWTSISFHVPQDTAAAKSAARKFIKAVKLQFGGMNSLVVSRGRGAGLLCCSFEKAKSLADLLPADGELRLVPVTDKQFEKSANFWGKPRTAAVSA